MGNNDGSTNKVFSQRVAIFVDVQNMFYSAKLLHHSKLDYGKLLRELTGSRQLVRAIAYIVQKPDINQSGFHDALGRLGYELKIKELKARQDADNAKGNVKGSWDVGLTVDALNIAPKIDTFVLVSGDGDYLPLVDSMKNKGCRVEVVSFERSISGELVKAASQYIPITENLIFKEKKFDGEDTKHDRHEGLGSTVPGEIDRSVLPEDDDEDFELPTPTSSKHGILS